MKKKNILITIALIIIFIVVIVLIILPPSLGKLPEGHVLSEKTHLEIDGAQIGMILLSDDTKNPVLLVCGGGPGIPQYLLESLYPSVLPEYFTVCYFDYRGTGLSFDSSTNPDEMTTVRYIEDVLRITDYLKNRFGKERIYIMGHSFGTFIALNTVANHPENFVAYLAMSQACDQHRSELLAYDYMRARYEEMGDSSMVTKFDEYNIKESDEAYRKYVSSSLRDTAMHALGVGTTSDMDDVITDLFFSSLRVKAYTPIERINLWRGKAASKNFAVHNDSRLFNAFESVPRIEIPVYFFAGEYDMTCCTSLQKEYYEVIDAPEKRFFLYEGSAHSPIYEDGEKTCEILESLSLTKDGH
ncbi:MAG: alpha/beta fold hydrolase [Spirochaetaceae bacterium]|nr:alpha/beta fold hydrolase [Spirochaetaceae bacterium]